MTQHQRLAHQQATRHASLYPDEVTRRWMYRRCYRWACALLAREEAFRQETRKLFREEEKTFPSPRRKKMEKVLIEQQKNSGDCLPDSQLYCHKDL